MVQKLRGYEQGWLQWQTGGEQEEEEEEVGKEGEVPGGEEVGLRGSGLAKIQSFGFPS